jgi:hypothetical protein
MSERVSSRVQQDSWVLRVLGLQPVAADTNTAPPGMMAAVQRQREGAAARLAALSRVPKLAPAASELAETAKLGLQVLEKTIDKTPAGKIAVQMADIEDMIAAAEASAAAASNPAASNSLLATWRGLLTDWRSALEQLDGQIAELQKALRRQKQPELDKIAEFGLNAVTGNHKVRLMAALHEVGSNDIAKLAERHVALRQQFQAFLAHIETDRKVAACDSNPFGVHVAIQDTLTPALSAIISYLSEFPAVLAGGKP